MRTDHNITYGPDGAVISDVTVQVDDTAEVSERTLTQRADAALVDLRAIRDTSGNLSSAQLSNAVRVLARVGIALIRLHLRRFDGTE